MPNGLVTATVTALWQLEGLNPCFYPMATLYTVLHSTLVLVAAATVATVATLRQLELLPLLLVAMSVIVHLPYRHHTRHT